ncbi:hypothetical protein KP509_12G043400 [Ceratopteris richardii]|nr:hypothetical protein KP509_12G043400 [Ceratopteris richardii]
MMGSMGHGDGYEIGSKRQRGMDEDPYYGPPSGYRSSYGYGGGMGFGGQSRAFPVVRLRGLPFDCREMDVYEFFTGLDIVDILLVHKRGRFSGEAYVVFGAPLHVDFALQRNRQNMGRRYIEVFRCKKQEYYQAIAMEVNDSRNSYERDVPFTRVTPVPPKSVPEKDLEHTEVLRLRGLPFSVSKREIINFFNESFLKDENIHIVTHSDGRATGEAFVEFSSPEESKAAMKKDKMTLGSRYVELFPSSRDEATSAAARSRLTR